MYICSAITKYTVYYQQLLSSFPAVCCMPTYSIMHVHFLIFHSHYGWNFSSTTCRTQKHYNFTAGIPAMQVYLLVHRLPGASRYLVHTVCISFQQHHMLGRLTLTYESCIVMLQEHMCILHLSFQDLHILFQDCTPSIKEVTINDTKMPLVM